MEVDGLEANLVSKVGSKEAKCGFSGKEALAPLGAAKVGVMAKTSPTRVGVIRAIAWDWRKVNCYAKGNPLTWEPV